MFTWCHIFPLLGKYSLSACTTGNDGYKEVGSYLEKILAATTMQRDDDNAGEDVSESARFVMTVEKQKRIAQTVFDAFVVELINNKPCDSSVPLTLASAMYMVGNRRGKDFRSLAWFACARLFCAIKGNPIIKQSHAMVLQKRKVKRVAAEPAPAHVAVAAIAADAADANAADAADAAQEPPADDQMFFDGIEEYS